MNSKTKLILSALVAVAAIAVLVVTFSGKKEEKKVSTNALAASYQGVLPCADCTGIDTKLFLQEDDTFVLESTYLETQEGDITFAEYGAWTRGPNTLILTDSDGQKRYYNIDDNQLHMLDSNGQKPQSEFNYTLESKEMALPETPMVFSGFYRYMADAAVFKDCATGKMFPMANTIELERAYAQAYNEPGEPVFLTLKGHFRIQPSMEEGMTEKALILDSDMQFDINGECSIH